MKFYNASFSTVYIRFNLMVLLVVIAFAINLPFLALFAFPIFMSAILGIRFEPVALKVGLFNGIFRRRVELSTN